MEVGVGKCLSFAISFYGSAEFPESLEVAKRAQSGELGTMRWKREEKSRAESPVYVVLLARLVLYLIWSFRC